MSVALLVIALIMYASITRSNDAPPRQRIIPAEIIAAPSTPSVQVIHAKSDPKDIAAYSKARDEWLDAARTVVNRTGDAEAKKVYALLVNHAALGRPILVEGRAGMQLLVEAKKERRLFFIPALPSDISLFPHLPETGAGAMFDPDIFAVRLRPEPLNAAWRGFALLHEGDHALSYLEDPKRDWHDTTTYCSEERDTHAFQNQLFKTYGGYAYTKFHEAEVARIAKASAEAATEAGVDEGNVVVNQIDHQKELDAIFGASPSKLNVDLQGTHTWIDAYFTYIARRFPERIEVAQTGFLCHLYQQGGILPQQHGIAP